MSTRARCGHYKCVIKIKYHTSMHFDTHLEFDLLVVDRNQWRGASTANWHHNHLAITKLKNSKNNKAQRGDLSSPLRLALAGTRTLRDSARPSGIIINDRTQSTLGLVTWSTPSIIIHSQDQGQRKRE